MLTVASTTRRGRRAAIRNPSSSGTGSRAESAISQAVRRGARAESASARTVLVRAARTAGTKVAATATPSATAVTRPTVDMVSGGAPALPTRPALGSVSSGAVSHPTASPAAAASRATTTYSARSTAATRLGVPPTALSSPTRRIWSAIRLPTSTATLATASRPSSQLPVSRARRWFSTRLALASLMSCQELPARAASVAVGRGACRRTPGQRPGRPASGSRRGRGIPPVGRGSGIRRVSQTRPAGMQRPPRQDASGYGGDAAVTATPTTWNDRLFRVVR